MKSVLLSMVVIVIMWPNAYGASPSLDYIINSEVIDTVDLNGSRCVVYDLDGYDYDVLVIRTSRGVTLYEVNDSDVLFLKQYGASFCEQLERL